MKANSVFIKHKYRMICKCGYEQVNNDDKVIQKCKLVKTDCCEECDPQNTKISKKTLFTFEGVRIYS
jgi:hypothetical protein